MKKMNLSLPAAVIGLLLATNHAEAATFTDIDNTFAKQDILALANKGIITGYGDGTFRPNKPVTRAEYAKLLVQAKGIPLPGTFEGVFRDTPRGEWYTPYVELSYRLGVTSGVSAGSFAPQKQLTREEMVKMTVSALGRESETARRMSYSAYSTAIKPYVDRGQISSWAVKSMAYAAQQGIVRGTTGGELNPKDTATRADVAALLNRSVVNRPQGTQRVAVSSRSGSTLPYMNHKPVEATAYTHSGALTYIGMTVREGMVAVDPTQISLGSHLYIPGYGYGIAGDTGGAIKSARVDLFKNSYDAAIQFGRRQMNVYVID